jgi:Ca2+-transporting ATPase
MNWYRENLDEIVKKLDTDIENGLTSESIILRLEKSGFNQLPEKEAPSSFQIFIKQFINPLMAILVLAAFASLLLQEFKDAIVIGFAALINVVVGFIQEFKAESAVSALKSYEVQFCKVKRDGKIATIDAKGLVPGDIVILSAGDKVAADIRLTQIIDLRLQESILTGESRHVTKNIEPIHKKKITAEQVNMAFAGTFVLSGKGQGIVVATGSDTQLGQIAEMVTKTREEETPLQVQIGKFSWFLAVVMLSVSTSVLIIGLISGIPLVNIISIAVALAVASVPEGLIVTVTAILAVGMQRMLKRKALVRHLVAAETLGSVSVICTDKTGTITEGKMLASQIVTASESLDIDYSSEDKPKVSQDIKNLLILSVLNNDALYDSDDKEFNGNPTEVALLRVAMHFDLDITDLRERFVRLNEIPFAADTKFMATVNKFSDKNNKLILKGAPEIVFEFCQNDPNIEFYKKQLESMASRGLRILAVAEKLVTGNQIQTNLVELRCRGLFGVKDPLRPQAKKTVEELKGAGIKLVLVTGDHQDTAMEIAQEAGLDAGVQNVITGIQLEEMSDDDLEKSVENTNIFARVEPKHKIRIVEAYKKIGKSVAMIGDGVNDAPALKAADIGVALGSGSDVAYEISDMVLVNNNLSSISAAVREGRVIFDNIRKILVFLVSHSFSEVVMIFGAILCGLPLPLLATQIFWINLIQHGFMHIALILEPGEPDIMKRAPRAKTEPILNYEMKFLIFIIGLVTDLGLFAMYVVLLHSNIAINHIRTILFTALAYDSLFYVFAVKDFRKSLFEINIFDNMWLVWAAIAGFFVQLAALYLPFLQDLFQVSPLSVFEWLIILFLSMIKVVAIELAKKFFIKKTI